MPLQPTNQNILNLSFRSILISKLSSNNVCVSVELAHIKFMGIGSFHYHIPVEHVFELDFVQSAQVAFQSYIVHVLHKKEERRPGMRSG